MSGTADPQMAACVFRDSDAARCSGCASKTELKGPRRFRENPFKPGSALIKEHIKCECAKKNSFYRKTTLLLTISEQLRANLCKDMREQLSLVEQVLNKQADANEKNV
jgi:hypothetical protein